MGNSIYLGGGIKSAFCGGNVKEIWQGSNKIFGGNVPKAELIFSLPQSFIKYTKIDGSNYIVPFVGEKIPSSKVSRLNTSSLVEFSDNNFAETIKECSKVTLIYKTSTKITSTRGYALYLSEKDKTYKLALQHDRYYNYSNQYGLWAYANANNVASLMRGSPTTTETHIYAIEWDSVGGEYNVYEDGVKILNTNVISPQTFKKIWVYNEYNSVRFVHVYEGFAISDGTYKWDG